MKNIFTEHPHSINETYLQHMKFASGFGMTMVLGGLACLIHALFPFAFKNTGSNVMLTLTHNFVERMPRVEPRVESLSRVIEKKIEVTKQ